MYVFKAFVFTGKRTAGKALDTLEDRSPAYPWIDDASAPDPAATVVRENQKSCASALWQSCEMHAMAGGGMNFLLTLATRWLTSGRHRIACALRFSPVAACARP